MPRKSIQSLTSFNRSQFYALSESEQIKVVTSLNQYTTSRIKNLQTKRYYPRPYTSFMDEGGYKTKEQISNFNSVGLYSYYLRQKEFLGAQTTTIKGYEKWRRGVSQYTGYEATKGTDSYKLTFWNLVARAQSGSNENLEFYDFRTGTYRRLNVSLWQTMKNAGLDSGQLFDKIDAEIKKYPNINFNDLVLNILDEFDLKLENIAQEMTL